MAPERRRSAERRAPRSPWLEVRLERLDLHRESRPVLRELSWRILPGQRWVVLGDNGAGKTQLLKLSVARSGPIPPCAPCAAIAGAASGTMRRRA